MDSNNQIIKDHTRNEQLKEDGYAIFPFLKPESVARLKATFYENHQSTPEGFYASSHSKDIAFRNQMNERIRTEIITPFDAHTENAQALGGCFISKAPGIGGLLPPHQDWNIVDESVNRSFNLWIPLVDVNAKNGAVHVLPGSHLLAATLRGPNLPNPYQGVHEDLWKAMEVLEMKAGEALLYDHRLVHGSPVNQSEESRLAVVYGVVPKGVPMRYYYRRENRVEVFESTPEFWIEDNPMDGPGNLKSIGFESYSFPEISKAQLHKFLGTHEAEGRSTFFQRLGRIFKR